MNHNMNQQCRNILRAGGSAMLASFAGMLLTNRGYAANWDKADFESREFEKVLSALQGTRAVTSNRITLRCPETVENGSVIPVEIQSDLPDTDAIAIMIDNNPFPLAAKFDLYGGATGYLATRIRLAQSSPVRAIVRSGGQTYSVSQLVKITVGGCGDDESQGAQGNSALPTAESPVEAPMKIRAAMHGDIADIKCLMNHIMETGLRKDAGGRVIPPHHITNFSMIAAGKKILDAQFGGGIARNPYLGLKVKGIHAGDVITANWLDNSGHSNNAKTLIV